MCAQNYVYNVAPPRVQCIFATMSHGFRWGTAFFQCIAQDGHPVESTFFVNAASNGEYGVGEQGRVEGERTERVAKDAVQQWAMAKIIPEAARCVLRCNNRRGDESHQGNLFGVVTVVIHLPTYGLCKVVASVVRVLSVRIKIRPGIGRDDRSPFCFGTPTLRKVFIQAMYLPLDLIEDTQQRLAAGTAKQPYFSVGTMPRQWSVWH